MFYFMKNSFNVWDFSFPSFHTAIVFCALPIIKKEFTKFWYFWLIFAILVSFSRVYFGVHYFSDILFGAFLGYLIGLLLIKLEEKYSFTKKLFKTN